MRPPERHHCRSSSEARTGAPALPAPLTLATAGRIVDVCMSLASWRSPTPCTSLRSGLSEPPSTRFDTGSSSRRSCRAGPFRLPAAVPLVTHMQIGREQADAQVPAVAVERIDGSFMPGAAARRMPALRCATLLEKSCERSPSCSSSRLRCRRPPRPRSCTWRPTARGRLVRAGGSVHGEAGRRDRGAGCEDRTRARRVRQSVAGNVRRGRCACVGLRPVGGAPTSRA